MRLRTVLNFALLLSLTGCGFTSCDVAPAALDDNTATALIKNMAHKRDSASGNCYGMVQTKRWSWTGTGDSNSLSITWEPCPGQATEKR